MIRVLLLSTGGTIASRLGEKGLEPGMTGNELIESLGDLRGRFQITVKQIMHLDSSNIQAEEWKVMARAVHESYDRYDGFIITHGTDTMAYSASMLCYMLPGLHKPVVFTGSQIPMDNMLTDARNNLFCALAAVEAGIKGVSVAFNRHIIRGCRAVKVRTMGFDAFESVNARYLGEIFADGLRVYDYQEPNQDAPTILLDSVSTDVFLLKLIPNTNPKLFDYIKGRYLKETEPKNDIIPFLEKLKANGVKMGIATATGEPALIAVLEKYNMMHYFSAIYSTYTVGASKTEPKVYDVVLEELGTDKATTWVFEDALYAATTAKKADYNVVGIYDKSEPNQAELKETVDIYINNYCELNF